MLRTPPHILVTTPESLYLLLTAERSREMLRTVRTVIVDEIHAVIGDAARRPPGAVARAAGGGGGTAAAAHRAVGDAEPDRGGGARSSPPATSRGCAVVDDGHRRHLDLGVELPGSPLDAVMAHEVWEEVLRPSDRAGHRAPDDAGLREHAADGRAAGPPPERAARRGRGDRASRQPLEGDAARRRDPAENRAAQGARRHGVARARHRHRPRRSGLPDRLAAPHRHAAAAGRPLGPHHVGHAEGPRLSRCRATTWSSARRCCGRSGRGELDGIVTHDAPLDVLAQQIVAECACRDWREDELFGLVARAWPYRDLDRGVVRRGGRDGRRRLRHPPRPARGAGASRRGQRHGARPPRRAAAGPDLRRRHPGGRRLPRRPRARRHVRRHAQRGLRDREQRRRHLPARQRVVADPAGRRRRRARGRCAAARRRRFRSGSARRRRAATSCRARSAICARRSIVASPVRPARRAGRRVADGRHRSWPRRRRAGGVVSRRRPPRSVSCPTQDTLVLERFFDESGGMQLVLHAPFGSRINRAWGAGAAQAVLPAVQLRAAGGGDRGRAAAVARAAALVPACRRLPLPASGDAPRHAGPGVPRRAGLPDALALEHDDLAGRAAQPRRPQGAAAAAADAGRRPDGGGLPRRRGLPREHPRRPRDSRSSAGRARRSATASRRRWTSPGCAPCSTRIHRGELRLVSRDTPGAVAVRPRDPQRAAVRVPRRCAARGAASARGAVAAASDRATADDWARSTPPRSSACATRRGPIRATPTSCTTRC